ncbi:MAG: GYF domain-containing protein [Limisphaerales bacterium]
MNANTAIGCAASAAFGATDIWIAREGKAFGPYPLQFLQQLLSRGDVVNNDLAWARGSKDWEPLERLLPSIQGDPGPSKYHHVATWKFVLLSLFTLGLYHPVWFYKNWKFIKERDGSNLQPVARGIFGPIWLFKLASDISLSAGRLSRQVPIAVTVSFLLTAAAWVLPEPFDLISYLSFIPLLVLVRQIDKLNADAGLRGPDYARLGPASVTSILVGAPILFIAFVGSWNPAGPAMKVLEGSELTAAQTGFLRQERILQPDEGVLYFHSPNRRSIESQGQILTNRRVISYSVIDGRFIVDSARFADVATLRVNYSPIESEDTEVYVQTAGQSVFKLTLPAMAGGDRQFVQALKVRTGNAELDPQAVLRARLALEAIQEVLGPKTTAPGPLASRSN